MSEPTVPEPSVRTTCPYCGVGCGVLINHDGEGNVTVKGDPDHPANFGRLCSKGSALAETLVPDGRLTHPRIGRERSDWDSALDLVADRFRQTIKEHGPESVGFYVSGQLLTEDYYVANKLMKGFIGTANIDTNSRLCMSSAVAAHKRAFGADLVPACYEDIEAASLVVLVGSNLAWCHPVLYQRLLAAREKNGTKIVVIDPRRTASCDLADLHLPIRSESDITLFNGLLSYLLIGGRHDPDFILARTSGLGDLLADLPTENPAAVAEICGIPAEQVRKFYKLFAANDKTVTLFSQGVNQSAQGTDKANAIINCHLLTGRIGRPGAAPFSITGQPNAMGGREVGGLANMLAAHMDFTDADCARVQKFWHSPTIAARPGLKAVDMFEAARKGKIKALWIMGTNPAVSLPDSARVGEALEKCDFVVVSDVIAQTDTTQYADILLPACGWSEKSGMVTNSERRLSRQRAFLPAFGEAMPDWWIISQVAKRMGFGRAFDYDGPAAIFREHAALTAVANKGQRQFNIGGLAGISDRDYDSFKPRQWPIAVPGETSSDRLFSGTDFQTADGKARFVPTLPADDIPGIGAPALILNTGRTRDQWHTMTRTGLVPRLAAHQPEPVLTLHPEDAARSNLCDGGWAKAEGNGRTALFRIRISPDQELGTLFIPIHWSASNSAAGPVNRLIGAKCDPVSGQPDLKNGALQLSPWIPQWHGCLVTRRPVSPPKACDYWARRPVAGGHLIELAAGGGPNDWQAWASDLLSADDLVFYMDAQRGAYRWACIRDNRVEGLLFVTASGGLPDSRALGDLLNETIPPEANAAAVLAGILPGAGTSCGRQICSCFGVGETTIREAIANKGLDSVQAIGEALQAGTNCGSCIPELNGILRHD